MISKLEPEMLVGVEILQRNALILTTFKKKKTFSDNIKRLMQSHSKLDKIEAENEIKKNNVAKRPLNTKGIMQLLKKNKNERTKLDVKILSTFLCEKYNFFKKMKDDSDLQKVEALIDVINLEVFQKNDKIIKFGEDGNKFYIVLEGTVGIYKPKLVESSISLKHFVSYLNVIKTVEKDEAKLRRIEDANIKIANFNLIKLYNYDHSKLLDQNIIKNYFIEEDDFLVEKGEGEEFGEVALLQKVKRTATVTAHSVCNIVAIEKFDYNNTIRKLEQKKFNQVIEDMKKNYRLIKNWTKPLIVKLMGNFSKLSLNYGDVLCEQNKNSDEIYFTQSGNFEFKSSVSMSSLKNFINYVNNNKSSLVNYVNKHGKFNDGEIQYVKEDLKKLAGKFIQKKTDSSRYPMKPRKEKLIDIKLQEEEFKNGHDIFSVKIRTIENKEIIGLEEALELKTRYYTIKCISPHAEIYKIKLDDFLILITNPEIQKSEINHFINERKEVLIKQLKSTVEVKVRNKERLFENQYTKFMNEDEINEKTEINAKGIKINNTECFKMNENYNSGGRYSFINSNTHRILDSSRMRPNSSLSPNKSNNTSNLMNSNNLDITKNFSNFDIYDFDEKKKKQDKLLLFKQNRYENTKGILNLFNNNDDEKAFDNNLYRKKIENKNFEEITDEISRVIGTSIINPLNVSKRNIRKTFENKLMSISSIKDFEKVLSNQSNHVRNFSQNTINFNHKDSQLKNDVYNNKFIPNEKLMNSFSFMDDKEEIIIKPNKIIKGNLSNRNESTKLTTRTKSNLGSMSSRCLVGIKNEEKEEIKQPLVNLINRNQNSNFILSKRYEIPVDIKMKNYKILKRNKKNLLKF